MGTVLDRPLYLTTDNKIVEEGDPTARFVLGGKGSEISDVDAKLYGLEEYLAKGSKATKPLDEAKAAQPDANKMQQPAANKGRGNPGV